MGKQHASWLRPVLFVAVTLLTTLTFAYASLELSPIIGNLLGPLTVERIDGDTCVLEGGERVRVLGVDARELGEPHADDAAENLALLMEGSPVYLVLVTGERDVFGRLQANVYVEDANGAWVAEDGRRFNQLSYAPAAADLLDPSSRTWCVDLNSSSRERLMEIIHIGEVPVDDLMKHRTYSGIEQLTLIKGIGPARLEDIKEQGIVCPFE